MYNMHISNIHIFMGAKNQVGSRGATSVKHKVCLRVIIVRLSLPFSHSVKDRRCLAGHFSVPRSGSVFRMTQLVSFLGLGIGLAQKSNNL